MTRDEFLVRHEPSWREFESLLRLLETQQGIPGVSVRDFPARYRRLCHQLALCRSRRYGLDLERRLQDLALRGYRLLYRDPPLSWGRLARLFAHEFPAAVRRHRSAVRLAIALFVIPALAAALAVRIEPDLAPRVLGFPMVAELEAMYADADSLREERPAESDVLMFGFYIRHNISIALQSFAGGLFYGVGSLFVLVFNGLFMGAVEAHLWNVGSAHNLYRFISGHSALELCGLVLAGAAGLSLGESLLSPGSATRVESLRRRSLDLVPIVYGAIALLVAAAGVEAFWSARPGSARVHYAFGAILAANLLAYLCLAGRTR